MRLPRPGGAVAVIAGSGLSAVADLIDATDVIPFTRIPRVGATTVPGHAGEIRVGVRGDTPCALVMGRRHFYEGAIADVDRIVEWLARWGATDLIVLSAAGGLSRTLSPGDIIAVRDMIDMHYSRGRAPSGAGPVSLDPHLATDIERAASECAIPLCRGTLVCGAGPAYETRSEVGFLQWAGGDLVTMSSAPEVVSAHRHGLRVAALGVITNPATGISGAVPRHDEVIAVAGSAGERVARIISQLIT